MSPNVRMVQNELHYLPTFIYTYLVLSLQTKVSIPSKPAFQNIASPIDRASVMQSKVGGSSPIRDKTFSVSKTSKFSKNIRSWVENKCCALCAVDISAMHSCTWMSGNSTVNITMVSVPTVSKHAVNEHNTVNWSDRNGAVETVYDILLLGNNSNKHVW